MKHSSEIIRLGDSVVAGFLLTMLLKHHLGFTALWVYPMPNTRGPVWVNLGHHPLLNLALLSVFSGLIFLCLWLIDRLERRHALQKARNLGQL